MDLPSVWVGLLDAGVTATVRGVRHEGDAGLMSSEALSDIRFEDFTLTLRLEEG